MNALRFPDYSLAIFDAHGHLLAENPVASSEGIELPSDREPYCNPSLVVTGEAVR
jgi:hypothetical protein